MTLILLVLAFVLMALGALPTGSKVDLWKLGTACVVLVFALGHFPS